MPNWNSNRLTVTDLTEEQLTELTTLIENEVLFGHYVPQPDWSTTPNEDGELPVKVTKTFDNGNSFEYSQFPSTERNDDRWHTWCIDTWGTKWDICDSSTEILNSELIAYFNTAWSPPIEGMRRVSEKFPNATFVMTYEEDGCDFCGAAMFKGGHVEEKIGTEPSVMRSAWMDKNHPGVDHDELYEDWLDVSGEIIEQYVASLAAELTTKQKV